MALDERSLRIDVGLLRDHAEASVRTILAAILKAGSGQVAALVCAALSMKILAVIGGPAGVGLYSLLRQVQQTLSTLASVGGQNAIVQGVASRSGAARVQFIATGWMLVGIVSVATCACTIIFSGPAAALLLPGTPSGAELLRWSAFAAVLGAWLIVARSLLNAYMAIGAVANVNIATALAALVLTYPAAIAHRAGWNIALAGILAGSLAAGLAFALIRLRALRMPSMRVPRVRSKKMPVREFLAIGMPSLLSGMVGMAAVLAVRSVLVHAHGLPTAGYFDAAWSVSLTLVVVFLTSVQTYLLPALSDGDAASAWRDLLSRTLRLVLLLAVPIITTMIVMKPLILKVLYSDEFVPALDLLRWTLAGDYVRVAGWVLATALVARADMRSYLAVEIVWSLVFVGASYWLLPMGIEGIGPAYLGAYAVYLVVLIVVLWSRHGAALDRRTAVTWVIGAVVIATASLFSWSASLSPWHAGAFVVLALGCSVLLMTGDERVAALRMLGSKSRRRR